MSSHREAPEISKDPVADSTDVYAFVSPDKPDTVTLIANYIPLQSPAGGPNFYEFGDDVLYEIHIDNNGDGRADISYQFRFSTTVRDPDTFLYNVGPIESLSSPNWNRVQTYSVSVNGGSLGSGLACPPCNIGPLSTPDYASLAARRGAQPGRRDQRVRRAARRGLLRRPGRDLRPGRPAAVREPARPVRAERLFRTRGRGERHQPPERALDRDPGADLRGDQQAVTRPSAYGPRPAASGSRCGTPTGART